MSNERLDKFIASQRSISRTQAKELIRRGRVTVNGRPAPSAEMKLQAENDEVRIDGAAVTFRRWIYLMLNKPAGVLSASRDPSNMTVIDLVPAPYRRRGLFPAGRLDKDTTGFVLITDDGVFAHRMLSPKNRVSKVYEVVLDGPVTPDMAEVFAQGMVLADGRQCMPAQLTVLTTYAPYRARVVLYEGMYHQIKRMFGALGLGVVNLHRSQIGGIRLDPMLVPGECREMSTEQITQIFYEIG